MSISPDSKDFSSSSAGLPCHVAIIMDGNGRWAKARGLPRTAGHKKGADAVRKTLEACGDLGIQYLTLFAFSSENWTRPEEEVGVLMGLLKQYLKSELAHMHRENIRFKMIGDRSRFSKDILRLIENAEDTTKDNDSLQLTVALGYGGRDELIKASQKAAEMVKQGSLQVEEIDEAFFPSLLETAGMPDPDLLIRTSGEKRISNFLLWQLAYAELVFIDTLWPDFNRATLDNALAEYTQRDRRYGGIRASG